MSRSRIPLSIASNGSGARLVSCEPSLSIDILENKNGKSPPKAPAASVSLGPVSDHGNCQKN